MTPLRPVLRPVLAQFLSCSFRGKEEEERAPAQRVFKNRGKSGQTGREQRSTPVVVGVVARPILDANWTQTGHCEKRNFVIAYVCNMTNTFNGVNL